MMSRAFGIVIAAFISSTAVAAQPSLFNCTSQDGTLEVAYTTSSFAGPPTFSVHMDGVALTRGEDRSITLKRERMSLGQFISASVSSLSNPAIPVQIYGVFIPDIELGQGHEVNFDTYYVAGSSGGSQLQPIITQRLSNAVKLSCEGKLVFF